MKRCVINVEDKQKNKNILDVINEHPILKKYAKGGGIGLIFAIVVVVTTEFIKKADLSEVIEWLIKLISLIQRLPNIVIIVLVIILCIFVYLYKKTHDKEIFRQKFLRESKEMIKNDSTIYNITMQEDRKKESISINVQRDNKKGLNDKVNSNIVKFRRDNSEVK